MLAFYVTLQSFIADRHADAKDRGATAVEYALMVSLIAVAIVTAVIALGAELNKLFGDITAKLIP